MMNLKFLTSLNVAYDDDELLDVIEHLAAEIEAGTLAPKIQGDAIVSLYLTPAGLATLPTLPDAAA